MTEIPRIQPRGLKVSLALVGALALAGCGGGTTTDDAALTCSSDSPSVSRDPGDDARITSSEGSERPARSPNADLVAVAVRRGDDGIVCVTFRAAGPVRLGSDFALITRQAGGAAGESGEQRYEIQLTPEGDVNVSRPYGEPRYPVRAEVVRDGDRLRAALETLLQPGESFEWRAESSYLPDFPIGDMYVDAVPNGDGWVRVPASADR